MVPGFRYHVATIAAIFLALGIGIIIGSTFVSSAIVQQQTRKLTDLRTQFSNDVATSHDKIRVYSDFIASLTPMLLSGRLNHMRVALVQTGDYADASAKVRDALEEAGATVSSVTQIDQNFPIHLQADLPILLPLLKQAHPGLPANASAPLHALALAFARGSQGDDLTILAEKHLISQDGDYSHANDCVVLIGGATEENQSRAEELDVPLIEQLKPLGVTVLYAEPESAVLSYVSALKDSEISTVDNVDTDIGRIALVMAINADRGDYGMKLTARSGLLPSLTLSR